MFTVDQPPMITSPLVGAFFACALCELTQPLKARCAGPDIPAAP